MNKQIEKMKAYVKRKIDYVNAEGDLSADEIFDHLAYEDPYISGTAKSIYALNEYGMEKGIETVKQFFAEYQICEDVDYTDSEYVINALYIIELRKMLY